MSKKRKNKKKKKKEKKNKTRKAPKMSPKEDTRNKFQYHVGHIVKVRKGINDPDYGIDIEGWKGKIYHIEDQNSDDPLISIEWDIETQQKIPVSNIEACEKDDLDYKKMSLFASDVESAIPTDEKRGDKSLITTMTKEPYMLARIHYDLLDKLVIQDVFSDLRCMNYDRIKDRWVWLYEDESRKIKFNGSYDEIPQERRPIVLGSFYSMNEKEMYLDVNSFDRAVKAILFFDEYFSRTAARVSDITLLNKIFDVQDGNLPKHADCFDRHPVQPNDPEKLLNKLKDATSSIKNPLEKLNTTLAIMENENRRALPEMERFPTHFHEEGITGLQGSLAAREAIAMEHWQGNKNYSFQDISSKLL